MLKSYVMTALMHVTGGRRLTHTARGFVSIHNLFGKSFDIVYISRLKIVITFGVSDPTSRTLF